MAIKPLTKIFERHRGMNDSSTIKRIDDNELFNVVNFDYVPVGGGKVEMHMRDGTSVNTMSSNLSGGTQIQGVHFAEFTAGDNTVFVYNSNIYRLASSPVDIDAAASVPDTMHDFTMFQDKLIIAARSTALREVGHNGTVSDVAGTPTPPEATYIHAWHNILFAAQEDGALTTLQWTEIGDRTDWPAANIQAFVHGELTGINSLHDTFYIFFKNKIMSLTGYVPTAASTDFVFDEFADVGCISHYGIVSNGSTLFFPSRDGIFAIGNIASTDRTTGGLALLKLSSQKVDTFWRTLDRDTRDLIHGVHDPELKAVRWSVRRTAGSVNDRELVYYYHEDVFGFSTTEGREISCYSLAKDTNGQYSVIWGDSRTDANGGVIHINDSSTTDDGDTIEGKIETKAYDFGRPDLLKRFHEIELLAKGEASETDVKVSYGVGEFPDYEITKTFTTQSLPVYDTAIWDADVWAEDTFNNYAVGLRKLGQSAVFRFVTDTSTKKINIASWRLTAQPYKQRHCTNV